MITVEAVLALVPFILVVLGIISFANIFMVHNKVQHAIYETANELSAYTYLYEALGIRNGDNQLQEDIKKYKVEELTQFLTDIEEARASIEQNDYEGIKTGVQGAVESGKGFFTDPKSIISALVYKEIDEDEKFIKKSVIAFLAQGLSSKYLDSTFLESGGQTAENYLKAYGVKSGKIDFGNSTMFTDSNLKTIDIVAEYDLEIYFFKLFLKDPTIHIVQRAVVPAWLDGDGGTYHE